MKTVNFQLPTFEKAFSFVCFDSSLSFFQGDFYPFTLFEYLFMSLIFM